MAVTVRTGTVSVGVTVGSTEAVAKPAADIAVTSWGAWRTMSLRSVTGKTVVATLQFAGERPQVNVVAVQGVSSYGEPMLSEEVSVDVVELILFGQSYLYCSIEDKSCL